MVNKTISIGNLGKDAETKVFEGGQKVAKFSIATSESYRDKNNQWQEKTTWLDVVAWGTLADRAEKLRKGDRVYVEGKISVRDWQDSNGNNRRSWEIVSNYFRTIQKREEAEPVYNNNMNDEPDWLK